MAENAKTAENDPIACNELLRQAYLRLGSVVFKADASDQQYKDWLADQPAHLAHLDQKEAFKDEVKGLKAEMDRLSVMPDQIDFNLSI